MSKRRNYRVPSYPLSHAIDSARILLDKYGTADMDADDVAITLGYKNRASGAAATRLGTLGHYGLIAVSGKAKYRLSEIACMILQPEGGERGRAEGLVLAAKSPKLFQKLIDHFDGKILPPTLGSILLFDFSVPSSKMSDVATIFRENLNYAGMLRHGVVIANPELPNPPSSAPAGFIEMEKIKANKGLLEPVDQDQQSKPSSLLSQAEHSLQIIFADGREGKLLLPDRANPDDLDEAIEYLEFLRDRMRRNKKPLAPGPAEDE